MAASPSISRNVPSVVSAGSIVSSVLNIQTTGRGFLDLTAEIAQFIREAGAVSTCSSGGAGWACYAVPDERAALDEEIGRLQAENEKSRTEVERLKAELASRPPVAEGKTDEAPPKSDSLKKAEPKVAEGERKIEIPLPSDRDMDRVMSFLEQAWRRLVEMANRMQKDVSGKI